MNKNKLWKQSCVVVFFPKFNCHLESSIQPEGVHHAFPLHLNLAPEQLLRNIVLGTRKVVLISCRASLRMRNGQNFSKCDFGVQITRTMFWPDDLGKFWVDPCLSKDLSLKAQICNQKLIEKVTHIVKIVWKYSTFWLLSPPKDRNTLVQPQIG